MLTDSTYWMPMIRNLHRHLDGGIAQILYDQRGHGRSKWVDVQNSFGTQSLEDLDAILDRVDGPVVMAAHSVAGLLIQEWVGRSPGRARALSGIVLYNPCLEVPYMSLTARAHLPASHGWLGSREICEQLGKSLFSAPTRRGRRACRPPFSEAVGPGYISAEALLAELSFYAGVTLRQETVDLLREIPTWVVVGQNDPVVRSGRSREFANQIWADFDAIPDVGHSLIHQVPECASEPILNALEVAYQADRHYGGPR